MKKLDKMKKYKQYFYVFLFLTIISLFSFGYFFKGKEIYQTTFPNDIRIQRYEYELPYTFNLDFLTEDRPDVTEGIIKLTQGIDLSNVYKISYVNKGCSSFSTLTLEDTDMVYTFINSLQKCGSLFFSDISNKDEYQHYDLVTSEAFVWNLSLRSLKFNFNDFDPSGDQNQKVLLHEVTFWEYVDCTRDSHCAPILIGKLEQETRCDQLYHKCRLDIDLTKPEEYFKELEKTSFFTQEPVVSKAKDFSNLDKGLLSITVLLGCIAAYIWFKQDRRKKNGI